MDCTVNVPDTLALNEGEQAITDDLSLAAAIGKFTIEAQPSVPWAVDFQNSSTGINPVAQFHVFGGGRRHTFLRALTALRAFRKREHLQRCSYISNANCIWPFAQVMRTNAAAVVSDLSSAGTLPTSPWRQGNSPARSGSFCGAIERYTS